MITLYISPEKWNSSQWIISHLMLFACLFFLFPSSNTQSPSSKILGFLCSGRMLGHGMICPSQTDPMQSDNILAPSSILLFVRNSYVPWKKLYSVPLKARAMEIGNDPTWVVRVPLSLPFLHPSKSLHQEEEVVICKVHPPAVMLSLVSGPRQTHNNSLHNTVLLPKGIRGAEGKTVWEVKAFMRLWPKLVYRRWLHMNPSFGVQSLGLELLIVAVAFLWAREQHL